MKLLRVRTRNEIDDQLIEIVKDLYKFLSVHHDFNPEKLLLFKEGPDQYLIRYKGKIRVSTYKSLAHFIHLYKSFGFWDIPTVKKYVEFIDWVENAESYKGLRGNIKLRIKSPLDLSGAGVYSLWSDITHIPQEVDRYEFRWSLQLKGDGDIGVIKSSVSAIESKVFANLYQWLDEHDAWYVIPRGCGPFDNSWSSTCHIEFHVLGGKEKRLANWEEAYLYSLAKHEEIKYNAIRYALHKEEISKSWPKMIKWTNNFDFTGTSWVDADMIFEYYGHHKDIYEEKDAIYIFLGEGENNGDNNSGPQNNNKNIESIVIKGIIIGVVTWAFR